MAIVYYTQKKNPIVLRKPTQPKTKKYKLVKTKAVIPCKTDHSIGLRLSQRLDQIIYAFRQKNASSFATIS